jgi:hypothetical protein
MKIKDLLNYSKPGIWGFFNEKDKRFFISHSNNILAAVSRNISQIQDKSHSCRKLIRDLPNLNFVMLVQDTDESMSPKNRKIRAQELTQAFIAKGYTSYSNKLVVAYKIRTVITTDYLIQVQLVNKRNDKIVVGVFDKLDLAESFISTNYPNNTVSKVIYSDNNLTTLFYKETKEIR